MRVPHIKDVLHHIKLMAPYAEFQQSAPCEYFLPYIFNANRSDLLHLESRVLY